MNLYGCLHVKLLATSPGLPKTTTTARYQTMSKDTYFTVTEVAERLRVSTRHIRRAIANHELVAHHFGRVVRISSAELERFERVNRGLALDERQSVTDHSSSNKSIR
jgi:excisionase family DNA binding protein